MGSMQKLLNKQDGKFALVSLHPRHAEAILDGSKRLEFRRVWTTSHVDGLLIYVTAPVKRIVAIAKINAVHHEPPSVLWKLAKTLGGGLSKIELFDYLDGKEKGYAIQLSEVWSLSSSIDPISVIPGFRAPQSFMYAKPDEVARLAAEIDKSPESGSRLVFVGGIHGVGKTTVCTDLASRHECIYRSASGLIKERKANAIAERSKRVKDIKGNQQLLVEAVMSLKKEGRSLLLDGHFTLRDDKGRITDIPTSTYSDIGVDEILLIQDKPEEIRRRLIARDGVADSLKSISAFQDAEINNAVRVARELDIPLHIVTPRQALEINLSLRALIL